MRGPRHSGGGLTDGGIAPPDVPVDLLGTEEGPMRRELLRQIAHLEEQISRFIHDNCPFETPPAAMRRGPALLSTSELEHIRDELLAARTALHQRVVERAESLMPTYEPPRRGLLARLLRRR